MKHQTFIDDNGYSNFTITKGITRGIPKNRANQQAIDYAIANQQQVESTNYLQQQMGQETPRTMDLGQSETIDLGDRTSGDSDNVMLQPEFAINTAVGILAENDKANLVKLLQNQGSFVTSLSPKKTIIDATFKTIKDNADFRKKLGDYIIEKAMGVESSKPRSQKDGSLIRIAQGKFPTLRGRSSNPRGQAISSNFSSFSDFDDNFANNNGQGKEKVKKLLGSIFTEENITKAVGYGMGYLSTRLNANASKGTNQQAIDFEKAQTEKALAQAQLEQAKSTTSQGTNSPSTTPTDGKGKKKWVMPVAIGGGVLVLGTIIYFVMKKKK
jgi:hypothetical protein